MSSDGENEETIFTFAVGERVKVWLPGKRFGQVGIIEEKQRLAKAVMPPPTPDNYYWLKFEPGQPEEAFTEENLELVVKYKFKGRLSTCRETLSLDQEKKER